MEKSERNWVIDTIGDCPPKLHYRYMMWNEVQDLFCKYNCVSLGWGAPDFAPPAIMIEELKKAMEVPANNNYGRPNGHPDLVKAIAEVYGKKMGHAINPMTEIIVSQGANGLLATTMQAFVNPGDEVVVFTPAFPVYEQHIELAGGKMNDVPLTFDGKRYVFNPEELRAALKRPETRILLLNSPSNPLGKCFTLEE